MSLGRTRRRSAGGSDTWPGFVDALSSLLLVIIFLLSVFVLAQFFLGQALSGRDAALEKLNEQVLELGDLLALERQTTADLRANINQLSASLTNANMTREELLAQVDDLQNRLSMAQSRMGQVAKSSEEQMSELETLRTRYAETQTSLVKEQEKSRAAKSQVDLLTQQLASLRQQLARLEQALQISEQKDKEQQATIVNLGKRLNAALASKVEELARYRSEFFGRLREVLGNRSDIRIQGDRFIFESEVLFGSASDQLGSEGKVQMAKIAKTLLELAENIPPEVNWILRVDGHTDILPINTERFPSNWELSTARAISVARFLQSQGVPPERLAATGFGPYQPIDARNTPEAYKRNRRIELKLTER